jgi:hypothetical protein
MTRDIPLWSQLDEALLFNGDYLMLIGLLDKARGSLTFEG